jgi:PAS domain S-box-containing protein
LRVAIEKAIRTKSLFELEHRVRRADGTIGWTMSRAVPIVDESGEITEWLGAARDVSTRREAEDQLRGREERLRLALGAGRMAIWDWDIQQNTLRWNDEHYRMLGFEPGSVTPSYKLLMSRIFPGDAPKLEGFIRNTLNSRAECVSEFRLLGKDDVPRWVEVHGRVELDSEGMPSLYGVVVDVTERKRAEEARAQSQRMEALGQLTGGIAHDYNNLLGVIAGHLEMAGPRITDARAQMAVRQALDAVMMGASLNRRLLSFSRRRKLTPQVCNLNERIADMLPLLQRSLGEPIKLSTALDQSLWPTRIDPGEINSALINLAHNARDAMTAGGQLTIATANISLDADEAARLLDALPGDYVRLTIADTGHGMPPDVLARAIEPFFTTKEMGKGTGLGLSSVYGFCTQSGGFLSMTSTPGEGTTVSLYLPRSEADEGTSMTVPAPDRIPMGDGELILVVEDNDRLREVASSLLESLDYTVLEARSGPEAVEILETEEPVALVFSDVVMPGGMSGYDVAQWLEAKKHNAKIVLTSGYNDTEQSEPSTTVGITVLAKPYNREQLSRAIDAALHAR